MEAHELDLFATTGSVPGSKSLLLLPAFPKSPVHHIPCMVFWNAVPSSLTVPSSGLTDSGLWNAPFLPCFWLFLASDSWFPLLHHFSSPVRHQIADPGLAHSHRIQHG